MNIHTFIIEKLTELGLTSSQALIFKELIIILGISLLCVIINYITKMLIVRVLLVLAKKSTTQWDDYLFERRVFHRLSHLAPAFILYSLTPWAIPDYPVLVNFVIMGSKVYMVGTILTAIDAFLNALHDMYLSLEISKRKPIKGYIQIAKIIMYFIGAIIIISILINKTPTYLLGGLGAATAVLLLVFKDPIMGLVGSIQLSALDLVRPGDWISMPKYNADGTVLELNLTTIKVQNFDKTITTIPTYSLISESFQNWRGMQESGGRRIKRSVNIDMSSIKLCSAEMLEKFKKIALIKEALELREAEIMEYNQSHDFNRDIMVNGRRMTNIGVFRLYMEQYLKNHPKINQEMQLLVRQLQPTENGLPLEIYAFCTEVDGNKYEEVQGDIFDHVLAVLEEFQLLVFQKPSGADFRNQNPKN